MMVQQPTYHPNPNEKGEKVLLKKPSSPSAPSTWLDPDAVAVFVPAGACPAVINAVPVTATHLLDEQVPRLADHDQFDEPVFEWPKGLKRAAGVVVVEPDRRVWIVHPSNQFGGYVRTFPKGTVANASLRETAVWEAYEETGLLVELLGFLADSTRTTSRTRYYLGRRVSGTPAEMGWESQAVSLIPAHQLADLLNSQLDREVVRALLKRRDDWRSWFSDEEWVASVASGFFVNPANRHLDSAIRIVSAIDGFRARFGVWPTRVSVDQGMMDALRQYVLSAKGWRCLADRVTVDNRADGTVIASDDMGRAFEYGDPSETARAECMADVWIWGVPLVS